MKKPKMTDVYAALAKLKLQERVTVDPDGRYVLRTDPPKVDLSSN